MTGPPLPLTLRRGLRITVEVVWPRHPSHTPTGKVSKAKTAGKPIPWLSTNVVRGLEEWGSAPRASRLGRAHAYKVQWHGAAGAACHEAGSNDLQLQHPVIVEVRLYRKPAHVMDLGGIIEGVKPLIDGVVQAGLLQGDGPQWVTYDPDSAVYTCPKLEQRVELRMRRP